MYLENNREFTVCFTPRRELKQCTYGTKDSVSLVFLLEGN